MFDVACGECELLDFLLTRFNPLDLKTKINLAPSAVVDEQLKKQPEDEPAQVSAPPPVAAPTFGTIADVRDRPLATAPQPGLDTFQAQDEVKVESPPAAPTKGPDWLSLIQGFHAAAQRYQAEIEEPEEDA